MSGTLRLSASSQSARTNQIPFRHNALFPYIWQSEFHSSLVPARPVQTGKALLQVREATVIYLDLFSVSFGLVHSTLSFATTPENTCQATMISPVQTSLDSPKVAPYISGLVINNLLCTLGPSLSFELWQTKLKAVIHRTVLYFCNMFGRQCELLPIVVDSLTSLLWLRLRWLLLLVGRVQIATLCDSVFYPRSFDTLGIW